MFGYLINNKRFQQTMSPIVQAYRRWWAHPYAWTNIPPLSRSTTTNYTPSAPTYPTSSEHLNYPWTVTILSWSPSIEHEPPESSDPPSSYHTIDNDQLSVLIHPTTRRPPHPYVEILRRTKLAPATNYCTICTQTRHSLVSCIQRGTIICSNCHEVGHTRGLCNNLCINIITYNPRLQYCTLCEKSSHILERCFNWLFTVIHRMRWLSA